jgi:hypothetical protein
MDFVDLRPGDEIVIYQSIHQPQITCRAKVREHRGDRVVAVFWNESAARWNNNSMQVKPKRLCNIPRGDKRGAGDRLRAARGSPAA